MSLFIVFFENYVASGTIRASQVAARRVGLSVFTAPELHLVFFRAPDAQFPHLLVPAYFRFREFAVLAEDDVEAEPEYAEPDKYQCCDENFHITGVR